VHPADERGVADVGDRGGDLAALVERNNGIFGGCWCMASPGQPCSDMTAEQLGGLT